MYLEPNLEAFRGDRVHPALALAHGAGHPELLGGWASLGPPTPSLES